MCQEVQGLGESGALLRVTQAHIESRPQRPIQFVALEIHAIQFRLEGRTHSVRLDDKTCVLEVLRPIAQDVNNNRTRVRSPSSPPKFLVEVDESDDSRSHHG
jgi:hypothetical protein